MILFATKPERNTSPDGHDRSDVLTGWRWVFHTELFSLGWSQQYQCSHCGEWTFMKTSYYIAALTKYWSLGRHHCYYDGCHDSLDLGFLRLCWSGDWCNQCMPKE